MQTSNKQVVDELVRDLCAAPTSGLEKSRAREIIERILSNQPCEHGDKVEQMKRYCGAHCLCD